MRPPVLRAWLDDDEIIVSTHPILRLVPAELLAIYVARFWSRVEKTDGCYLWRGGRMKRPGGGLSYGVFCVGKKRVLAHVFAWLTAGRAIPAGEVLRHHCDNTPCVRLDHLEPGTQAQNLQDMWGRGRGVAHPFPNGTAHPNAKLTEEKACEVRALRETGLSLAKIGARIGLHASTVLDILNGRIWGEVTGIARVESRPALRVLVTMHGETKPLRAWCTELGIDYRAVHARTARGWDPVRALTIPIRRSEVA